MRIAIDIQPLQTATSSNGLGGYLRNLVQHLSQIDDDNEYTFLLNNTAHLADPGVPPLTWKKHYVTRKHCAGRWWWSWDTVHLPTALIKKNIDVYHYNSLAEYERMIPPSPFGKHRVVATVYDLSPLKFPETGSPSIGITRQSLTYSTKFRRLRHADAIIAISESVKQEIVHWLRFPEERIVVASSGVSELFAQPRAPLQLDRFLNTFQIPQEYILYDSGYESRRKNLEHLLNAYKLLRQTLPNAPVLALAGLKDAAQRESMFALIQAQELSLSVILLPDIPEQKLPYLYQAASLFVCPSLYESFSLPAAQALTCGTPVAASDTSAFPEIVGDAGFLFDPWDVNAMAAALYAGVTNSEKRAELRRNAPEYARRFSWDQTARKILDVYRQVHT
ncbi:glycosyl transferase group 1 [Candidatus Vecturithrix granuli]|uniref:Glycosyl transferase group 1 n=1 Tax=Vecturithrix granuli TaxID=1499967 RepID=A0A081BYD9_VECG1|nr:glycosyl transferase group 1 [Candidatus Vecturithrix granuli]